MHGVPFTNDTTLLIQLVDTTGERRTEPKFVDIIVVDILVVDVIVVVVIVFIIPFVIIVTVIYWYSILFQFPILKPSTL